MDCSCKLWRAKAQYLLKDHTFHLTKPGLHCTVSPVITCRNEWPRQQGIKMKVAIQDSQWKAWGMVLVRWWGVITCFAVIDLHDFVLEFEKWWRFPQCLMLPMLRFISCITWAAIYSGCRLHQFLQCMKRFLDKWSEACRWTQYDNVLKMRAASSSELLSISLANTCLKSVALILCKFMSFLYLLHYAWYVLNINVLYSTSVHAKLANFSCPLHNLDWCLQPSHSLI